MTGVKSKNGGASSWPKPRPLSQTQQYNVRLKDSNTISTGLKVQVQLSRANDQNNMKIIEQTKY